MICTYNNTYDIIFTYKFIIIYLYNIADSDTDTASESESFTIEDLLSTSTCDDGIREKELNLELLMRHIQIAGLEKKVLTQQKTIERLRSTNCRLHVKTFRLKAKSLPNETHVMSDVSPFSSGNLKDFLVRQLDTTTRPRGQRYNSNEKMFALSLWHASPKCYNLLRSTFCLPSTTTLRRSIKMINMKPGFHPRILECIKDKNATFNAQESLVAIAFDEMSIKTSLRYDERLDSIVGYEDLVDGKRSDKIASYATVFMIRGILGTWKQPIGYFLTSGPMTADS